MKEDIRESFTSDTINKGSFSSVTSKKSQQFLDNFEPINIKGQKEIHHAGRKVAQIWDSRFDIYVKVDLMRKDRVEGLERIAEQKGSKSGEGLVKEELKECLEGQKDKSSS